MWRLFGTRIVEKSVPPSSEEEPDDPLLPKVIQFKVQRVFRVWKDLWREEVIVMY